MRPIVLDMESSGLNIVKCGLWQIGAIDLNNIEDSFFEESRIDDDDIVEEGALKVIGKTEEELRDPKKQSQKEMIEKFMKWVQTKSMRNMLCQNPQFDIAFLEIRAKKYGIKRTFQFRAFDMHTVAQVKYFNLNSDFLLSEKSSSDMHLTNVLKFCGIPDNRRIIINGEIAKEGDPHNALEDCKLTGECFLRIMEGKNLFPEYSQYEIPEVLKK